MTETIFSRLCGRPVRAGETVRVRPDRVLLSDVRSVGCFETLSAVAAPEKILVAVDHGLPVPIVKIPGTDVEVSTHERDLVKFAQRFSLRYEFGTSIGYRLIGRESRPGELILGLGRHIATLGVHGALGLPLSVPAMRSLLETGEAELCVPGSFRLSLRGRLHGADARDAGFWMSQSLDRKALQGKVLLLCGPALQSLTEDALASMLNLAPELGALSAMAVQDDGPADAIFDLDEVCPALVLPGATDRVIALRDFSGRVALNTGFIGGCGGGHIDQLRQAAAVFRGKTVGYGMRVVVSPVDRETYYQAMDEGLVSVFLDAGAYFMNPGCLACLGLGAGRLSPGEICIGTGSFNGVGCMGPADSQVYLASAATVARACVAGEISKEMEDDRYAH